MADADGSSKGRLIKQRAADGVVGAVLKMISQGDIVPGERIGSEQELIDSFGVSRAVVREALRLLEREGAVSVKPGPNGGIFCEATGTQSLSQSLNVFGVLHHVPPGDVLEARMELEVLCAGMAARHALPEDIDRLVQLNAECERQIDMGAREGIKAANRQFHLALAEAAHNQVFMAVMHALEDLVFSADLEPQVPTDLRVWTGSHRHILEAVQQRLPAEALERTREHLRRFRPGAWPD